MQLTTESNQAVLTDEQIEGWLRKEPKLHFKGFKYNKEKVKELILIFGKHATLEDTYVENGQRQCLKGKYRSFCDLYCFIINHRPKASVSYTKKRIKELIFEGLVMPSFCSTIKRGKLYFRPFHYHSTTFIIHNLDTSITEFGRTSVDFYDLKTPLKPK